MKTGLAGKGGVREGGAGNLESLWEKKSEEIERRDEGEDSFKRSEKTRRSPEKGDKKEEKLKEECLKKVQEKRDN